MIFSLDDMKNAVESTRKYMLNHGTRDTIAKLTPAEFYEKVVVWASVVAGESNRKPTSEPAGLVRSVYEVRIEGVTWSGPLTDDLEADGSTLKQPVPPGRWPYGPPPAHEPSCLLQTGGRFCDCAASAADDVENGVGS